MTTRSTSRQPTQLASSAAAPKAQQRARVYRAWTMADALAAVRQDLGADAMILHARAISKRGFLGIGRKDFVEVAAAPALADIPLRTIARKPAALKHGDESLAQTTRARGIAAYAESTPVAANPRESTQEVEFDLAGEQAKTRRLAREMLVQLERESAERKAATVNEIATSHAVAVSQPVVSNIPIGKRVAQTTEVRESVAQRFVLNAGTGVTAQVVAPPAATVIPITKSESELDRIGSVVDAVLGAAKPIASAAVARNLTTRVAAHSTSIASARRPLPTEALEAAYRALLEQEVAEQLADTIVARVAQELTPMQASDPECVRQSLITSIASMLPTTDGDSDSLAVRVQSHRASSTNTAFRVAFIGPTGVGKTTSIAKIAAMLRLRHGLQVGLVTADTYRIAAVEQLRTYAQILAIPLEVAMQPEDLTAACERLSTCDVVLIDTAGRSQNDRSRLAELGQFLKAGAADEVHLVMSATSSERALLKEAAAFGALGVHRIVLTKLDEAAGFGTLLTVTRKLGMRISFVTTGQEVPKDIEPACARRFAEYLVQGTTLSARVGLRS